MGPYSRRALEHNNTYEPNGMRTSLRMISMARFPASDKTYLYEIHRAICPVPLTGARVDRNCDGPVVDVLDGARDRIKSLGLSSPIARELHFPVHP
jgi:hypothetical protein